MPYMFQPYRAIIRGMCVKEEIALYILVYSSNIYI
jgi:hypothetical protein